MPISGFATPVAVPAQTPEYANWGRNRLFRRLEGGPTGNCLRRLHFLAPPTPAARQTRIRPFFQNPLQPRQQRPHLGGIQQRQQFLDLARRRQ